MFGFNTVSLDAKGRISMPARYRDAFKSKSLSKIVVTKDPQYPALKLYPGDEWLHISNKLQSLQGLDPIVRNIQWTILGNAHETEIDVNGRMLIRVPVDLQEYAEIMGQKQIAVVGMGNKFEIWNSENWDARQTSSALSSEILEIVLPDSVKNLSF